MFAIFRQPEYLTTAKQGLFNFQIYYIPSWTYSLSSLYLTFLLHNKSSYIGRYFLKKVR